MSTGKLRKLEEAFSERLKALRKEHGLSQEELASKLEVSPGSVGNWEIGPFQPHPKTLKKIAGLFDVEVSYLLRGQREAPESALREKPQEYSAVDLAAILREVEWMRDRLDHIAQQLRKAVRPGAGTLSEAAGAGRERRHGGGSGHYAHETSDAQRLVVKAEGKMEKTN